jgi:hypothetical protein
MGESNPMRWVVLSLVAAGLFAIGMITLVKHATESAMAKAKADVAADFDRLDKRGTPLLEATAAVAAPFIADVGAGRYPAAYARLAAPYRRAVSLETFARSCRASTVLSSARAVTLLEVRKQTAGGATSLEARGILDTTEGGVPAGFVFLEEDVGPRVLVVSLGGVPVLQGLAPAGRQAP